MDRKRSCIGAAGAAAQAVHVLGHQREAIGEGLGEPDQRVVAGVGLGASAHRAAIEIPGPHLPRHRTVLSLTRRGDVIVPRYHGQGGRLRRAGDPMPRVTAVSQIAIRGE